MSIVNKIRDIFVPPEDEEFEDEMEDVYKRQDRGGRGD